MRIYTYIFISAFICAYFLTWLAIKYSTHKDLVDFPNDRSSHQILTLTGGGISILVTSLIGLIILSSYINIDEYNFKIFIFSSLMIGAIGFLDDHYDIASKYRIFIHLLCSGLAIIYFTNFPDLLILDYVFSLGIYGLFVGIIFLTWILNLFNFMDGIDGICSVETIFIALAMFFLLDAEFLSNDFETIRISCLLIASSVLGFLCWNKPSAKIFMGDVGSSFIGFILGGIAIYSSSHGWINFWSIIILFGLFLVDATYTLIYRMILGEKWYSAHSSHGYQKVARKIIKKHQSTYGNIQARKISHRYMCLGITLINMFWLLPWALVSENYPYWSILAMVVALIPLIFLLFKIEVFNKLIFGENDLGVK